MNRRTTAANPTFNATDATHGDLKMKPNTLFAALSALLLSLSVAAAPASAQASLPDFDPTHVVADEAVDSAGAAALRDTLPATVSILSPAGDVADAGTTADAPEAIWLTTNKGCGATFTVGEIIRASWSVSRNDYYRLSIVTDQGTSYPLGAYWVAYQAGGATASTPQSPLVLRFARSASKVGTARTSRPVPTTWARRERVASRVLGTRTAT